MNNIQQITNFSDVMSQGASEYITIPLDNGEKAITVLYRSIPASLLTGSANTPINKLGYVCEPRGIDYPIILTTGQTSRTIHIGKTGMFETMPETFLNINREEAEELVCTPEITAIKLPVGEVDGNHSVISQPIKFKLDYVFATN